ncbi:SRPBCC family protein [Bacteroidota bacterium]
MTRIENSINIPAPVEEVFKYASDWQKWSEWFEGVSDFKPTTETSRGNGTRYAYKAKIMGLSVNIETEIHDFTENRGWIGKATKGMPHQTLWMFESVDGGTKSTYALEYELTIPVLGSLLDDFLMKPQWDKIIRKSLNNLKEHF